MRIARTDVAASQCVSSLEGLSFKPATPLSIGIGMDKHFLTPLFSPHSIVVIAGKADQPDSQTRQAQVLQRALRAQRFTGTLTFLDIDASGTLADLAQTQADLAIIAVPPDEVAAALEIAGRIKCRCALVISVGIGAPLAAELNRIAQHDGMHLLGPNCLGFPRPHPLLNSSVGGGAGGPGARGPGWHTCG